MSSLNPRWLIVEMEAIDATVNNWSAAVSMSYQSLLQTLTRSEDHSVENFLTYNLPEAA